MEGSRETSQTELAGAGGNGDTTGFVTGATEAVGLISNGWKEPS